MKYKVGDKVRIQSKEWYESHKNKFGKIWTVCLSGEGTICFDQDNAKYCGKEVTIFSVEPDNYVLRGIPYEWTDEMIECKVEEETKPEPKFKVGDKITNGTVTFTILTLASDRYFVEDNFGGYGTLYFKTRDDWKLVEEKTSIKLTGKAIKNDEMVVSIDEYALPEGYIFKDENGNVINATKIVLEKKKKEYNKGTKVRHKTKGMVETIVGVCKIKYMGAWVDGVIYEGNDTNTGEPMTFVRVKEDFENNFEVC